MVLLKNHVIYYERGPLKVLQETGGYIKYLIVYISNVLTAHPFMLRG